MESSALKSFRKLLDELPFDVRDQARRAYKLWLQDPFHSSLQFKRVSTRQPIYSVRIGIGYRALGLREGNTIFWYWIGPHAEYDEMLKHI